MTVPTNPELFYPLLRIASRSNCVRRQVGAAVFSQDGRLLATGFNNPDDPTKACIVDCPRALSTVPTLSSYTEGPGRCIAIHAEDAALQKTTPEERKDGIMYVSYRPCGDCEKLLQESGLARWEVVE